MSAIKLIKGRYDQFKTPNKIIINRNHYIGVPILYHTVSIAEMASKRSLECFDNPPSKKAKLSTCRQFQENWKCGNPWLRYESTSKSMFCDLCLKIQKSNTFTIGCTVLKRDSVSKHAKCKGNVLV